MLCWQALMLCLYFEEENMSGPVRQLCIVRGQRTLLRKPVLRIRDVFPGSWYLSIPDPGYQIQKYQQKRGVEEICCTTFFCSHKNHINCINFQLVKKKNLGKFTQNYRTFYPSSQKYGFGIRDPGSRKNLLRIPDPGVKMHRILDPGSGSATLPKSFSAFALKEISF